MQENCRYLKWRLVTLASVNCGLTISTRTSQSSWSLELFTSLATPKSDPRGINLPLEFMSTILDTPYAAHDICLTSAVSMRAELLIYYTKKPHYQHIFLSCNICCDMKNFEKVALCYSCIDTHIVPIFIILFLFLPHNSTTMGSATLPLLILCMWLWHRHGPQGREQVERHLGKTKWLK